jgi:hypothetical protein
MAYYQELAESGLRPLKAVALLGSFRRITEKETAFLDERHPQLASAATEVAMLQQEATRIWPTASGWREESEGDPSTQPNRARLHAWLATAPPVHVFAAASSEPDVRPANTADTLVFAAEQLCLYPGEYVQLVTSGIYSIYQFFESIRMLGIPYGVSVEVLGVPPSRALRRQNAASHAQEIRSSLRAALALVLAAKSTTQ